MNLKRILSYLFVAIAVALLVWWFAAGHHAWTATQTLVNVTTTDELFGTSVTTQKWVDNFTPGFLPFSNLSAGSATGLQSVFYSIIGFLGIGIMAFISIGIAILLWVLERKQRSHALASN